MEYYLLLQLMGQFFVEYIQKSVYENMEVYLLILNILMKLH